MVGSVKDSHGRAGCLDIPNTVATLDSGFSVGIVLCTTQPELTKVINEQGVIIGMNHRGT